MTWTGTETKSAGIAKAGATVLGACTATTTIGPPLPEPILANAGSAAMIREMAIVNFFISFIVRFDFCFVQRQQPARHAHRLQTHRDELADGEGDVLRVAGAVRAVGDAAAFVGAHGLYAAGLAFDSKSFCNLAKAASNVSWFFQFEKSGMKYSRTSSAKSLPVCASKHAQAR